PIRDKMKVALAGPLMNLAIAAVTLLVFQLFQSVALNVKASLGREFYGNAYTLIVTVLYTNLSLALFNMLPIPPLDGSKVLENFVSANTVITLREIEPYGMLV